MLEQTFVIIKPDAIERGLVGKIISRFEDKQLEIIKVGVRTKNVRWCKLHYKNITNLEILDQLYYFMTNIPLIGIVLIGVEAVQIVRGIVGITNSTLAAVGTIRGDYGTLPVHENLVHASDSEDNAKHEMELFFNE